MGTQGVPTYEKGAHLWLARCAHRADTRDFSPALAALFQPFICPLRLASLAGNRAV
jgi:hypothetical protein